MSRLYRRLETCGKPFVVCVHGICMGGATELALAAHGRVMAQDKATTIALPEVKIGIFPGAGGAQRVLRMSDAQGGLEFLLKGSGIDAKKALSMKLVDRIAPREELVEAARAMLAGGLKAVKPWDQKGYRPEGAARVFSPAGFQLWPAANALYRKETYDNYPGPRYLMQSAFEGLQLPMDAALKVESRYFAHVLHDERGGGDDPHALRLQAGARQGRAASRSRAAPRDRQARRDRRRLHGRRHRLCLGAWPASTWC